MRRLLITVLILTTLSGCSSIGSYVKPQERVDITPFAENTISLISEVNYGLNVRSAVYLSEYIDAPVLEEYRAQWNVFRPVLRGIAAYSIAIVTLSKSDITKKERAEQLAKFLDHLLRPVATREETVFLYGEDELDEILADIRSRENLLDGLRAAQPLIDEIARFSGEHLDGIKDTQDRAQAQLMEMIAGDHTEVLEFNDLLKESQAKTLHSLKLLSDYRHGYNENALDELLDTDRELREILPSARKASLKDLRSIEERLLFRLKGIRELKEQLVPDIEFYHNKIRELELAVQHATSNLTRARVTIIIWSRTHQRLAEGVTDPAKVDVMGLAKQALDASLPF
jgi:uncharacterized protein YceK